MYLGPSVGDRPILQINTTTGAIAQVADQLTVALISAQAAANPAVVWNATGNAANQRLWRALMLPSGVLQFQALNDAQGVLAGIDFNRDGTMRAVAPAAGDNSNLVATTGWVKANVSVGGITAPTYDTLNTLVTDAGTASLTGDTAMQITQGQQVFSRGFTAQSAANPIEVDVNVICGAAGSAVWGILGLFIDGSASAVAQIVTTINTSWGAVSRLYWQGVLPAGLHTFQVRFGGYNTYAYLNGYNGARVGGGAVRATMKISELGTGVQGPPGQPGPAGGWQTGDTVTSYRTIPSVGWIIADDGTIGDATSAATTRANADCIDLFNLFWPNPNCIIAGGKGASAAADWGAHKALSIPKALGRVLGVAGAAGAGLTARGVGDPVGVESGVTAVDQNGAGTGPPPGGWVLTGSPHNHSFSAMQPTTFLKLHIKL